jgi:hypothetical protein
LWLALLAVVVGIIVTLALVLGGKSDVPDDQAMQPASYATGSALPFGSGRSVPKLLLRRPPAEPAPTPVSPEPTSGKDLAPPVAAPAPTKDQQSPPDAQAPSNIAHDLAQRMRDIASHLKRVRAAAGGAGSGQ